MLFATHGDVAGLTPDALEPCLHGRVGRKLEASFMGDMRVGIEPDVGDRVALGYEEPTAGQMFFHHLERGVPGGHLLLELGLEFLRAAEETNDEAPPPHISLM